MKRKKGEASMTTKESNSNNMPGVPSVYEAAAFREAL